MQTTPFGMLFVETSPAPAPEIQPEYDPQEQISFCLNREGQKVPYIEVGFVAMGGTETGTATRADSEGEDADLDPLVPHPDKPAPKPSGTETFTKSWGESTD